MTETTTVRELVAKLSALPPDMLVFLEDNELGYVYEYIKPDITWVRPHVQFGGFVHYGYAFRDDCPQRPLHEGCRCNDDVLAAVLSGGL